MQTTVPPRGSARFPEEIQIVMSGVVSDSVVVEVELAVGDHARLEEDDPLQVHDRVEPPQQVHVHPVRGY